MRSLIVFIYLILSLNLAAGLAGAIVLPQSHPVVRALGTAISRPYVFSVPADRRDAGGEP